MKLILLDSHALVHRAYHAIDARLTSPKGEPTNATYGFTTTLLKVLNEAKPDYIAAAFDVGRTFRDDLYAAYKAQRPALPSDLSVQLARARDVVEALSIPAFGVEGYEADDVLGTLARQASERDIEVVIVTGDTDTFQLIGPKVRVWTFSRQFGEMVMYDEAAIRARYGLSPRQLIDFKALKGDPSDNIPGVAGIGEKTATKLLQQYGTLENIYAHLHEIDAKVREKLERGREQAEQGKKLVTIVTDVPIQLDLNACRLGQMDRARVAALFRELGFRAALLDRLPGAAPVATQAELFAERESTRKDAEARESTRKDAEARESTRKDAKENYCIVDSDAALDELVARLQTARAFAFDVETTDTDALRADLVGIAIGLAEGEAYYIPLADEGRRTKDEGQRQLSLDTTEHASRNTQYVTLNPKTVFSKLTPIFADSSIAKYAHNAKYDVTVLAEAGIETRGLEFDTMIAAYLIEPGASLKLKSLVREKFGVEMTEIESLIGKGKNQLAMSAVPIDQVARYACADADYTFRLVQVYQPLLAERGVEKLFREVEMPLVPVLVEMERTGVLLDVEFLARLSRELAARLNEIEKQITAHLGIPINIASPVQLADALFNRLKLPTAGLPKTKSGQISTAADVLESLRNAHPVVPLILEHRELSKLKGTYVDALPALVSPRTGRVHTDYNQTAVVTGRLSSSNPNLQNIPIRTELGRQVRRAFIAPRGSQLISADYSQVELRILAHVARDAALLEAFAHGEDIHAATAARLFNVPLDQVTPEMRRLGKTINFGIVYGITDYGIAARTELSQSEARRLIDNYFAQYPGVKAYLEETKRHARERGYVQTLLGRRRYFPELRRGISDVSARNAAEREAINHPIQGSAADIIKIAMVRLHQQLHARQLRARMILQVHDELVLECPEDELEIVVPLVRETMEHAYPLESKLKVDVAVGQNWDEMTAIK